MEMRNENIWEWGMGVWGMQTEDGGMQMGDENIGTLCQHQV